MTHRLGASFGERAADRLAAVVGSWRFLIIQSVALGIWMAVNLLAYTLRWDPYPFILLNLCLSTQAAYAAPILQMSSNRREQIQHEADHALLTGIVASQRATHALIEAVRKDVAGLDDGD